jgi:Fe-S oxidoreductase
MPKVSSFNFDKHLQNIVNQDLKLKTKLILYIDEFTRYMDNGLGTDAIELLVKLGYDVKLFYAESGRTYLSKGFLKEAQQLALDNVKALKVFAQQNIPVLGLEPSAILSFRDEYKRLVPNNPEVEAISSNSFLIEEFLSNEIKKGSLTADEFTKEPKTIKIHNHCHQKALSNQKVTFDILNLPENYSVSIISSGCCGMAGSFGYEKEHYDVSMQIGELKLFPAVRMSDDKTIIAANGTSCRHQIYDGTGREALHPISILKNALLN